MQEIIWTKEDLEDFKRAYAFAVIAGADQFVYDGNVYVVGYAGYLIEFLENKLSDA